MSDLPEYEKRVIVEKQELDEKIKKLTVFKETPAFKAISPTHRFLLGQQLDTMLRYSSILGSRIAAMERDRENAENNL